MTPKEFYQKWNHETWRLKLIKTNKKTNTYYYDTMEVDFKKMLDWISDNFNCEYQTFNTKTMEIE